VTVATYSLTTSPITIDDGTSYSVLVTNTGAATVELSRGGRLRPNQAQTVYPEGAALTAAAVTGTSSVSTSTTTKPLPNAADPATLAANAAFTGTYVPSATTGVWAASTSYAVGAKVTYSGRFWARYAAASSSETAFDPTKWVYVGRVAPSWGTSIVLLGNSRVLLERYTFNSEIHYQQRGFFGWAQRFMGQRFRVLNYAGVSGDTLALMAARWATAAGAFVPENVLIADFINDVTTGRTLAQIQADYYTLIALNRSIGARTILLNAPPKSSMTTGQQTVYSQANRWLSTLTEADVVVVDVASAVASPASLAWVSGYATDGLHQNRQGAARIGRAISNAIGPLVPPSAILPVSVTDATTNPVASPFMDGTPGTGVPTGVSVFPASGGVVAYTMIARTDRKPGNWFQMDTATTTTDTFASQTVTLTTPGWVAGTDVLEAFWEFQTDAITVAASDCIRLYLQFQDAGSTILNQAFEGDHVAVSQIGDSGDSSTFPVGELPGVSETAIFRTPPCQIIAGTTKVKLIFEWNAQGKVRLGRCGIFKV
jgi:lysophospholipase L1-like esterase